MPNQGAKVSRQKAYRSQWLRNALKSVGISSSEVLKEMAPNIYDAASSGAKTTQTVLNSMRRGGQGRVNTELQNNKYVKYATTAYKNAMRDIRSGNFNNKERMEESFFGDSISGLDDGFSFGDDGADSDVNINVIGDNSSGIASLSEQMSRQTEAQLKVSKANMDAYVAINAANMSQMGQMGQEIIGHLSSINNNLISLVQFNNENMNRFIEASISYYDRVGTKMDQNYTEKKEKITAASVVKSTGGVDLGRYKQYVKQQIKESAKNSNAGFVASMIDDQMLDMLAANPLGFLSTGLVRAMVPKVLTTTVQSMETAFNNAVPNLLSEIADWTDDYTAGIKGNLKRAIGKAFGLKDDKVKSIGNVTIERGAIPFDGETKHAITEVITKELRDQTGYLEIIAKHFEPRTSKEKMRNNAEYWDWKTNSYIKGRDINKTIADELVSSIRDVFDSSAFGKSMNRLVEGQIDPNRPNDTRAQQAMQHAIDELFVQIERQDKRLSLDDLLGIIQSTGQSKHTKRIISDYVKQMAQNDRTSFDNLNSARLRSRGASNEFRNQIMSDATNYNLLSSRFAGSDTNADDIIDQILGYGSYASGNRNRKARRVDIAPQQNQNSAFRTMARNLGSRATNFGSSVFSGDTLGAAKQIGGAFVDQASLVIEKFINSENGLIKQVRDNLSGIGSTIKDGFMSSIFGKTKDETGKYVKSGDGLLDKSFTFFRKGFDNWTDAIFDLDGSEDARKQKQNELKKYFKDVAPEAATDAVVGAGFGMVSGGLLGQLIGGPIGGAALGAATAFLKRNEKFQTWLFGDKDTNGERKGGLISKATQKFFKENKKTIGAGSIIGTGVGTLTGGGVLGSLVGGPVAGALLGAATGIISKSDTFKKFLYGDEKTGQKGVFNAVKDAFNKGLDGKRSGAANGASLDTASLGKSAGMGIIGAGTGAITAAMLGKMGIIGAAMTPLGPIGGAILGLGLSIKAQSGNFHKWLFGEKDGLNINGKKAKKQGVIGQLGNMLNANLVRPFATQLKYISKDFMLTLKHDVLSPFSFAAEYIAGKAGDYVTAIRSSVSGVFGSIGKGLKSTFAAAFAPAVKGFQKAMSGVTSLAYKTVRNMVSLPGNLIKLAFKSLDLKNRVKNSPLYKYVWSPIRDLISDTRKLVFKGIGSIFGLAFKGVKGIFNVATAPVRFVGGLAARGINKLSDKVRTKLGESIEDRIDLNDTSFFGRFRNSLNQGKVDRARLKGELADQKRHDENAKLIAKYTKNQYSVDTDEAREYLRMINPKKYYELIGRSEGRGWKAGANGNTSITAERNKEREDAEVAKNGRGIGNMTSEQLSRANVDTLNEEARQTYFLQGIFNIMRGKTWNGKKREDAEREGEGAELDYNERQKWQEEKKNEIHQRLEEARRRRQERYEEENDIGQDEGGSSDYGDIGGYLRLSRERLRSFFKGDASQRGLLGRIGGELARSGRDFLDYARNTRTARRILGRRASGGDINKDGAYIVGENGPEIVELENGDHVVSNPQMKEKEKRKRENEKKLQEARERGKTKAEWEQEEKEKKKEDQQAKLVKATEDNAKDTKEHKKNWLEIFGKKGLITTALIAGFLLLKNKFPEIVNTIVDIGKKVGEFIGTFGGKSLEQFINGILNKERKNGQSMAETATEQLEDLKDGNVLSFNEDGSVSNQTGARLRGISSIARATIFSRTKLPFEGKFIRRYKKGVNFVKDVGAGIKGRLIGKNADNLMMDLADTGDGLALVDDAMFDPKATKEGFFQKMGRKTRKIAGETKDLVSSGRASRKAEALAKANGFGFDDALRVTEANGKYADDLAKSGRFAKTADKTMGAIDNMATKVGNTKAGKMVTQSVDKLKGSKGGKLLDTVCGYIKEFFDMIITKFNGKTGKAVTTSIIPDAIKPSKIISFVKNYWDELAIKISSFTGGRIGADAVSAGLAEAVFVTLGAIEGASGTAKLFHVDKKDVDGKMRLISTVFGGIAGSTPGGVIDLICQLFYTITNIDILSNIASALYKVISDDEDDAKLDSAQDAFHNAYLDYQSTTINDQYETQKKAGLIDSSVTLEQFQKGVNDGTYKVDYKSFADYNTDTNASIGDKMMNGIGKGVKSMGKGIKKFFKGETVYEDVNGNTYKPNNNGGYDVFDSEGNNLGAISRNALPQGVVEKKNGGTIAKIGTGLKSIGKSAASFMKTITAVPKAIMSGNAKIEGNWNNQDMDFESYLSADVNELPEDSPFHGLVTGFLNINKVIHLPMLMAKSVFRKIGNKIKEKASEVFGGMKDIAGNVAKINSDLYGFAKEGEVAKIRDYEQEDESLIGGLIGSMVTGVTRPVYTALGGFHAFKKKIKETFEKVKDSDTTKEIKAYVEELKSYTDNDKDMSGFDKVQMGGDPDDVAHAVIAPIIKKIMKAYVKVMRAIHWIGDKVSDIKEEAGEWVDDKVEGAKEFGNNVKNGAVAVGNNVKDAAMSAGNAIKGWFGGGSGNGDSLNGIPYYSQNDPRWKNAGYNIGDDDATMGEAGCGPTAMAMVGSNLTGKNINPMTMAALSKMTGNRDQTGTNWNFIGDAASSLGLSSTQAINPSASYIDQQLNSGNPVILSGAKGGYGKSPYTKAGHYVVAVGKDSRGNVIVNDPRGKGYSGKYNINDVARQTGSAWSFGRGGFGTVDMANGIVGSKFTYDYDQTNEYSVRMQWVGIVRSVKAAIAAQQVGYSQSNWIEINVGGKSDTVRTDCSGFVSACLRYYGVMNDGANLNSSGFTDQNNSVMQKSGFRPSAWVGWENLQEGDIIATNGHVEIFAYNDGNSHYVYNCGSDSSCNSAEATRSGHKGYTTVWSPGAAGSGAISPAEGASVVGYSPTKFTPSGNAVGTPGVASNSAGSSKGSKWDQIKNYFSNFFSEFGSRAMSGLLTGDWNGDYSNLNNNLGGSESSGGATVNNSGNSVGNIVSTGLNAAAGIANNALGLKPISGTGNTVKDIWNKFKEKGMSKFGIAAILGNLDAESGVKPNNLQNTSEKKLGLSDDQYTAAVDNGSYANFAGDSAGYGLAQWTSSGRKQNLLNFARSQQRSIADPGMQADFLYKELSESYPTVLSGLMNASDVKSASDLFMTKFESPKDQSEAKKNDRAGRGMSYLQNYGGLGNGGFRRYKQPNTLIKQRRGGFGASVESTDITSLQASNTTGQFRASQSAQRYVTAKAGASVADLLFNAVQILAVIAGNTSESNDKLNALNELSKLASGSVTNNNNLSINNTTGTLAKTTPTTNEYRSTYGDSAAKRIALGGY